MAISEAAQRNHERLFPHQSSTLQVTDPEFIEIFDDFACDEVAPIKSETPAEPGKSSRR